MKISCPACNAKYRIPDDRVRGKNRVFRISCKKCDSEIRVRGIATQQDVGRTTMPFNLEMPDTAPATPQRVWFAGIGGKQVGPLTEQEVLDHIAGGRLSADDLVWRKGFGAWTPVREVSAFQAKVNETDAAPQSAQPARSPRRSQTLELSAAMIELLVKLDAQQGAESDDSAADMPDAEPPSLPALDAGTSAPAVPDHDTLPPLESVAPPALVAKPPVITSKPPVITSKPPVITSKPPVTTTAPPVITSKPPVTTTVPPVTTTVPPVITTVPPVITSKPPVTTTAPPVITSKPPVTTTAPPVTTTAPPVITSKPPVITSKPPVSADDAPPPVPGADIPPAVPQSATRPPIPGAAATHVAAPAAEAGATSDNGVAGKPSIVMAASATASSRADGKSKSKGRDKRRGSKGTAKVSLPGQAGGDQSDSSEAETKITSVPLASAADIAAAAKGRTASVSAKAGASATAVSKAAGGKATPGAATAGKTTAGKAAAGKTGAATAATGKKKEAEKGGGFGWFVAVVLLLGIGVGGFFVVRAQTATTAKTPAKPTMVAAVETAEPPGANVAPAAAPVAVEPDAAPAAAQPETPDASAAPTQPDAVAGTDRDTAGGVQGDAGAADRQVDGSAAKVAIAAAAPTAAAAGVQPGSAQPASAQPASAQPASAQPASAQPAAGTTTASAKPRSGGAARAASKPSSNSHDTARPARAARVEPKPAPSQDKPPEVVPKKERDEIDILLEKGRERERLAAAQAKSAKKAAQPPAKVTPPKAASGDSIDEILRREAARKKAAADKKAAANTPAPPPKTSGGSGKALTSDDVSRIAKTAKSKVMDCYMDHGDVDGGRVTFRVKVYVTAAGTVQNAKVMGKAGSGALGACIVSKVKTLRFPQSSGATSTHTVRYTVGG